MNDPEKTGGSQPPRSHPLHPLPRRVSPENSVTLRHHRLARDANMKSGPGGPAGMILSSRNSSGDSHDTGHSDAKKWFDQSNANPTATFDSHAMDVDPPFFQKETESSNEEGLKDQAAFRYNLAPGQIPTLKPTETHSSSADDYRSVIDDLTVEIQRLKEELKRYKQAGPDMLKKEKLFEIKIHGLPKRKKRELEVTLRDFAASLEGTPSAEASSQRQKFSRHANRLYSVSGTNSKHGTSSSGSHSRPVDSAYASMSTGPNSSGTSLGRPSQSSRARSSEQKVENYLKDIPQGLYPHHIALTEKDKKKLVVRRLEQLFTGRMAKSVRPDGALVAPVATRTPGGGSAVHQPPSLQPELAAREARILPQTASHKKSRSRDNGSTSHSNGDQTESGGNGGSGGNTSSGANTSPPTVSPPEQRPTRPRDLDPERAQIPSENMEYIKHLGLVPPDLLPTKSVEDVSPDAEGWVYLNLLCNLAQLHMINVTPDFICTAVTEKSEKFQLSKDGRKIRWRGGFEGTKFSSDSSGENSQQSASADETDSDKGGPRKKKKTGHSSGGQASAPSSKNASKFGPQLTGSSANFHYKPLFVRRSSSHEQTSADETLSSYGPGEDSNMADSRWGLSGSGSSQRKKRRLDGAIIYYSGAPFCTDLSGDPGDISSAAYMASTGQDQHTNISTSLESPSVGRSVARPAAARPVPERSTSGSLMRHRPLIDGYSLLNEAMDIDGEAPELVTDDSDGSEDGSGFDFPWSDSFQAPAIPALEPCGLGGVLPDDHFVVVVTTTRPKGEPSAAKAASARRQTSHEATESIIGRLATMSTSSPAPRHSGPSSRCSTPALEIEYVRGRIKRLAPVPLPPAVTFIPPFSSESSGLGFDSSESEEDEDSDVESSEELRSRRANPHQSDNTGRDDEDITSADEEGAEPDEEDALPHGMDLGGSDSGAEESEDEDAVGNVRPARGEGRLGGKAAPAPPITMRGRSKSAGIGLPGGSSAATAGGAESGYSSGAEES